MVSSPDGLEWSTLFQASRPKLARGSGVIKAALFPLNHALLAPYRLHPSGLTYRPHGAKHCNISDKNQQEFVG